MKPLRARVAIRRAACVAAALLAAACDVNVGNGDFHVGIASGRASDTWDRTYTVSPGGSVELENGNGAVEVTQATDGKLSVHAERIAKASSDEAAKQLLAKIEIVENVKPDAVRLETRAPKAHARRRRGEVLDETAGGARRAHHEHQRDDHADRPCQRHRGEHDQRRHPRREPLRHGVGQHHQRRRNLALTRLGDGGITAETTNGGMSIEIPSDSKADVTAHVANGGISVDNLKLEAVGNQSRRHVEGRINGGGARIELSTTNGGITLAGK